MTKSRVELINRHGRACVVVDGRCIDVAERSKGIFDSDPMEALAGWSRLCDWARGQQPRDDDPSVSVEELGPCVPRPGQVFAIGLNYRAHAAEAELDIPSEPMVFTKFPSCVAGPGSEITLTSDRVDWEVELVIVIGDGGRDISEDTALEAVAGYCVGQDISDRRRQFGDKPPQFSLGKSHSGFGPVGPAVVAIDCIERPDDLSLTCDVDGERMQDSRTGDMIFGVPALVAYLSHYCELRSGDLIFTGTPSGVGSVRKPRRYLKSGELIESEIEGLGRLKNRCR